MPEKWIVSTPNNVTSVRAIATGDGDTIPVPKGFYYVGGNLNTGVIISDEKDDEYDEKIDKTTYEYTTNLKGNQFVWIPCEVNNYRKTDWGVKNADYDTTTPDSELKKIEKYEGFYVGRYEAGLASEIKESTKQEKSTGTKTKYNDNEPDRELLTTGASSKTEKYHIFDIAGNLWELTDETSYYENNGQYCVVRGGAFNDPSTVCCASHRIGTFNKKETDFSTGFRTVLYIK